MPTYLSPGIYTRETDFSFYVKQISTSSAAMVGVAEKGPINKPVLVTSWEQFINRFGSYINESYLAYAARAFFDNGGSVLYVTRIAHLTDSTDRDTLTALKSSIVLQNREATPADALRIEAVNEGVWGDRLSISIEDGSLDPANHFNLVVRHKGDVVEVFKDLSMDETLPNHVELAINDRSDFILVQDLATASGTPSDRPALGVFTLSGGDNGLTDLADADFIGDPSQHTGLYGFDEIDALNLLMVPGVTTVPVSTPESPMPRGAGSAVHRRHAHAPEPLEAVDSQGQGCTATRLQLLLRGIYYPWLEINDRSTRARSWCRPAARWRMHVTATRRPTSGTRPPVSTVAAFNTLSWPTRPAVASAMFHPEGVNVIAVFPDTASTSGGRKPCKASPRPWTASTCAV